MPIAVGSDRQAFVVAHRGASGYRPEHTLAAYALAIHQGADYIEPDLVSTRDGVLVARHENEIGGTTDVADHPEFARLRTTKLVDDVETTGWFTEDFTLAELKTLRARERLPAIRPNNTDYDGQFEIPTLEEILDLTAGATTRYGDRVGIYVETKHPSYFDTLGLPLERPMLRSLAEHGYAEPGAPVFLESFETANLRYLAEVTDYRLIQLVKDAGGPYDLASGPDPRNYLDLLTPAGLREISSYATGVGLPKAVMIPWDETGALLEPAAVIADAHACGLAVHGWTFRRENFFLPVQYRRGSDPAGVGDLGAEIATFLAAGMDAMFIDNPDLVPVPTA